MTFEPTQQTWQTWLERLYNLRRDKRGLHERPHKPVLLLAILDLLDKGVITRNEVLLSKQLVQAFRRYFAIVRKHDDRPTIENPFYHLSGDGFWHLEAQPGQRPLYEEGNASRGPTLTALRGVPARFDPELWNLLLSNANARHHLREALIARYFPEFREELRALAGETAPTEDEVLREEPPGRDAAFRHTILDIYDYRCAACGIRVRLTRDLSLVQAAHIIPFGISRNDKPNNGLALCPNHHWAMDRFLIAPCPDSKHRTGVWQVGNGLDSRIEGQKDLAALKGQRVIPPSEEKFYPALESLTWRQQQLKSQGHLLL